MMINSQGSLPSPELSAFGPRLLIRCAMLHSSSALGLGCMCSHYCCRHITSYTTLPLADCCLRALPLAPSQDNRSVLGNSRPRCRLFSTTRCRRRCEVSCDAIPFYSGQYIGIRAGRKRRQCSDVVAHDGIQDHGGDIRDIAALRHYRRRLLSAPPS